MKTINVVNGPQNASTIILGCMRMPALSVNDVSFAVHFTKMSSKLPRIQ